MEQEKETQQEDNRHPREPTLSKRVDDSLGFVVDIVDPDARSEGANPGLDPTLQIKPHPLGYQATVWFQGPDGERKQNDTIIRTEDPRDG